MVYSAPLNFPDFSGLLSSNMVSVLHELRIIITGMRIQFKILAVFPLSISIFRHIKRAFHTRPVRRIIICAIPAIQFFLTVSSCSTVKLFSYPQAILSTSSIQIRTHCAKITILPYYRRESLIAVLYYIFSPVCHSVPTSD